MTGKLAMLGKATFLPSLLVMGFVSLSTGCAGWREKLQPTTLTAKRQDRAAEAVREFEDRRDAAQLEAALDRWNQGDANRAEAMIAAIIHRRPEFAQAQMRLGEILWSRGDVNAEPHLRAVLQTEPNRAEAHHALGLVLDGTSRSDEARQHLRKAAELEPDNEVYRQTCELLAAR